MAWVTATVTRKSPHKETPSKPQRWLRLGNNTSGRGELDQIFDLYWGGPERRLTGIALRIIAVNATALLILMLGILYLGQYQSTIISARLQIFESELKLISAALGQSLKTPLSDHTTLNPQTQSLIANLAFSANQRVTVLNPKGEWVGDSFDILKTNHQDFFGPTHTSEYISIQVLRNMAGFVLDLFPQRRNILPLYQEINPNNASIYPDIEGAQNGDIGLSIWKAQENRLFLTASAPLYHQNQLLGIVLLTRDGQDIKESIHEIWLNILSIFAMTLLFTILLSIYLSGVIVKPLRNLASAAESVRRGQAQASDIPDLSHRHDEIGELSLVIRQMTEALWQRMDSIENFAADVAHELKNPLTSLRSAFDTLSLVKTDSDRAKLQEIIRSDITRMDRLITDIANASKLDAELSREEFKPVNLNILLQHFIDFYGDPMLRDQLKPYRQEHRKFSIDGKIIFLHLSSEEFFVSGLESRLEQVFHNLLSNALSFSPPGGEVTVKLVPMRRRISILFEDQGPGIPENKLTTIFERFYSERPQHEHFGLHSGLGLSICKHIIEAHGGRIFAENIKDSAGSVLGARFTIILNKLS